MPQTFLPKAASTTIHAILCHKTIVPTISTNRIRATNLLAQRICLRPPYRPLTTTANLSRGWRQRSGRSCTDEKLNRAITRLHKKNSASAASLSCLRLESAKRLHLLPRSSPRTRVRSATESARSDGNRSKRHAPFTSADGWNHIEVQGIDEKEFASLGFLQLQSERCSNDMRSYAYALPPLNPLAIQLKFIHSTSRYPCFQSVRSAPTDGPDFVPRGTVPTC